MTFLVDIDLPALRTRLAGMPDDVPGGDAAVRRYLADQGFAGDGRVWLVAGDTIPLLRPAEIRAAWVLRP